MLRGVWQALNCLSIHATHCRGVSRGNKNVGCGTWKRRFFAFAVRITGKLLWKLGSCGGSHIVSILMIDTTCLYSLCGQVLSSVPEARYLSIMVTNELSWSSDVQSIYSKANYPRFPPSQFATMPCQTQEVCLYLTCSLHIGICRIGKAYRTLTWPLAKDINKLENIQRRSINQRNFYSATYKKWTAALDNVNI